MNERILPSASAVNPLPVVSVASPPAVPSLAAVTTSVDEMMDQWANLYATLQQDLSNSLNAIGQEIAQEVSFVEQLWDHLLGTNPTPPSPTTPPQPSSDTGVGRGNASGSGSGNGTAATAHNAPKHVLNSTTQQTGSGSGSGSSAKMQPMTSGSGSGSGPSSSSEPATISGQVWLDNNGDSNLDGGEEGYWGDTVTLLSYNPANNTTSPLMTTTTTSNTTGDNFQFVVPASELPGEFEVEAAIPPNFFATEQGGDSHIRADGFFVDASGNPIIIGLASGDAVDIGKGGLASMIVTTTQDDATGAKQNKVTLRDAIGTGNNGPTEPLVTFQGGLNGTIVLQKALPAIKKSYNVAGPGASTLAVSGANSFGVFAVNAGVTSTISGLTIENGYADSGGGVFNSGTLTLTNDTVANNDPNNGGGIFNKGKAILIKDDVSNNTATGSGGGIYNAGGGTVTISGSDVYNNRAANGGGIFNANGGGGGATLDIKNGTTIDYNIVTGGGGGVDNSFGAVSMTGGSIYENSAGAGGGIYTVGGNVHLTYVYLYANFAKTGNGGGMLENKGSVTLKGGTVQGNTANNADGGGIYLMAGALTLDAGGTGDVTIGGGNTAKTGGGMYLAGGTTNFGGCTVDGNTATVKAAGVAYRTATATLNPKPPIPAADLTDNDDPGGQPVKV